ncbi:MAG TPA: DUF2079 domain-containing protein [Methylomirabilota bacterium]|nr:DUF2079 domain-containing protein [Methylomirabilota bacterium]
MTAARRLLDGLGVVLLGALGASLLFWSGRIEAAWARPEGILVVFLAVASLRLVVAPADVPAFSPRRVVLAGTVAYALGFSFVTVTRHLTLQTHALDLGYYVQLTWNLAQGQGPRVSLPEMHAWGDHLSPIMYLFVPVFWVAPGPVALLVAQSAILALGAPAVFGIAARRLGDERPAAAFALLYLANPSLHGINVRDFHAAALAIPLLLAAVYFAEAGRPWLMAGAAALTMLCREDAALAVLGLGLWLGLGRRRWREGAVTAVAALAVFFAEVGWIVPTYRGQPYSHLERYAHLGRSVFEIALAPLLHPLRTLGTLLTWERVVYLIAMLAPLGFLPLLGLRDALGALPGLVENLLGTDPVLHNYRTQYQAFVLPFLFVAAIGGYERWAKRREGRWPVAVLVVAMVLSLGLASRTANNFAVARWWPTADERAAHDVMAAVPPGAALSAQDPYIAHLSLRPLVFVFPEGIGKSDHVLINAGSYPWRNLPGVTMERLGGALTISMPGGREYRYEIVRSAGSHLLLRRQ